MGIQFSEWIDDVKNIIEYYPILKKFWNGTRSDIKTDEEELAYFRAITSFQMSLDDDIETRRGIPYLCDLAKKELTEKGQVDLHAYVYIWTRNHQPK